MATAVLRRTPAISLPTSTRSASTLTLSRHPDPTFEKLMSTYKHYLKILAIQDLILSSPSLSFPLSALEPHILNLRLHKGARHFVRTYPHIFTLSPNAADLGLTPAASAIAEMESSAAESAAVGRVIRVLAMAKGREVPLRAVFRVWRELGLPDEFEEKVLKAKGEIFRVRDNPKERNTHILELVGDGGECGLVPKVEEWRRRRREEGGEGLKKVDEMELRYCSQCR